MVNIAFLVSIQWEHVIFTRAITVVKPFIIVIVLLWPCKLVLAGQTCWANHACEGIVLSLEIVCPVVVGTENVVLAVAETVVLHCSVQCMSLEWNLRCFGQIFKFYII